MTLLDELREVEERLWRAAGDPEAYERDLAEGVLHVFPYGFGIVDRAQVLAALASADPWESFTIDEPRIVELGPDAAALVYRTHAVRAGAEPYDAAITSVYVRRDATWRLALHQQTPQTG